MKILKNIYNRVFIIVLFFLIAFFYELSLEGNLTNKKTFKRVDKNSDCLEIYFLDVGEADSILLTKNNYYMLVDAGNNEDGNNLVRYFKDIGVDYFTYVFVHNTKKEY